MDLDIVETTPKKSYCGDEKIRISLDFYQTDEGLHNGTIQLGILLYVLLQ